MPPEQPAPEATPATPVAAPAATPSLATSVPEAAPSAKGPEDANVDGVKPTEEGAPTEEPKKEPEVKGAPETYAAFTAPEGVELPAAVLEAFTGTARKFNLSQEQAQEFLTDMAPVIAKQNSEAINAIQKKAVAQWLTEVKADAEIGGSNLEANLAIAHRAMSKEVATPALRKLLDDSGLGNHPEVIRWMLRVGKYMAPDQKHLTGADQTGGGKTISERIWGVNSAQ